MKILVINWQDIKNPLGGGAEVHLHEIFSRIARLGHDVTLFCSSFPNAPSEETIDGIRVIRQGGRATFNFRVPFAYLTRFRHEQFDVVIDDLNKIPFFTPLYVGKPLVAIAHHLFDRSIFLEANFLVASYVYWMERLALRTYRRAKIPFMVVSPSTQEEFLKRGYGVHSLPIIYNCVDHTRYKTGGVKSPEPLIGYFGRLKKYKSVDHLLQAIPFVQKSIPKLRVVIIGEGDDRPRLEALSKELGLDKCVKFTGFVSEDEKVKLLQQMWVKVTPSSKEGWGLTVLEANACGTPVIASNVPGLRDAIKDNQTGLLYEYGNVEELGRKILGVLKDSDLQTRLALNALQFSKQFDWDVVARTTVEELEKRINSDE